MHKILTLLVLLASLPAAWCANPPVITDPQITSITRTGARITWTTDSNSTTKVEWGLTAAYGNIQDINWQMSTSHGLFLSGLAGGTLYHLRACSTDSSQACSGNLTFTTLPEITTITELPVPPATVDVSIPALTGIRYTADNCADIQVKINLAMAQDGNLNHEVVIPSSFTCEGQWTLPVRTGTNPGGMGWIHIRSSSGNIPPEGVRAVMEDQAEMPTLIANRVQARMLPFQPGDCFYMGDLWWDDDAGAPALYRCTSQTPVVYTPVAFVGSSVTLPNTCNEGDWYYKTNIATHNERAHWCVSPNTWRQVSFIGGGFENWAAITTAANAKRYRVTGIRLQALRMPSTWVANFYQTDRTLGSFCGCLARTQSSNDRIIFDRILFDGIGYPNRTIYALCFFDGSHIAVINSYFNEINRTVPSNSGTETAQTAIFMLQGPGPVRIENNYFKNNIGLTIFASDDTGSGASSSPSDVTIRRNYFYEDPRYNFNDPTSNGRRYWRRNILELKRGERWLLEGNVFDGGWPSTTSGACVAFTPRPGNTANPVTTIGLRDITIRNNWLKNCPDAVGISGWNDWFAMQLTHGIRFQIENNLMTDLGLSSTGIFTGWPYNKLTKGRTTLIQLGMQDLTLRRNTIYNSYGADDRSDLVFAYQDQFPNSGLRLNDNVYYASGPGAADAGVSSASLRGTLALDLMWSKNGAPAWQMQGNVLVQNVANNPAAYPSGNNWASNVAALGLDSNYRLLATSPYKGTAFHGGDPGVNWLLYDSAQGRLDRLRRIGAGTSSITVAYQAPDGMTCTAVAGGLRFSDGGGSRDRLVTISGLASGTTYNVTVMCAVERKTISVATAPAGGSATTVLVRLKTPPNRGINDAVIDYGSTSALGSSTVAASCNSTCVISVPATRGTPVYLRVRWRNGSGQLVAQGRIEAQTP